MSLRRDVLTRFLGEDGSLQQTLRRVAGSTDNLNQRMDRFAKGARAAFIGAGVVAAAHYGKALFDLGIQADAMGRRFDTVFGAAGERHKAAIDDLAESLGIAGVRAQGMAADVGKLLISMGLSVDSAASASVEVLRLTDAYEQFMGGDLAAADISDKLTRGIAGQTRGLVELGVKFTEADVKARMAQDGMTGLTGEQLRQAEAATRLKLILEQSASVLDDYAASETDAERAADSAAAAIDELKISLGQTLVQLAPLVGGIGELMQALNQIPGGAAAAVGALAGFKLGGPFGAFIGGVVGLGLALDEADPKLERTVAHFRRLEAAAAKLGPTLGRDIDSLNDIHDTMGLVEQQAIATAAGVDTFEEAVEAARDKISRFLSFARPLGVEIVAVRDAVLGAGDAFRDLAGADAVAKFQEMLQGISLEDLTTKFDTAADDIVSIWGEIPERIEQINIQKAISDALTLKAQQTAFEADMETLALAGYSALVDSLLQNPDRAEAIALMAHFATDMAAAADFSQAAGLAVDKTQSAINAAVRRLTADQAIWNEFNAFMDARGYAAFEAFAAGLDRGAAGGSGQRIVDALRRAIIRGGGYGLE